MTTECNFCKGTGELNYAGICKVYLFPHKLIAALTAALLIGGIFYSPYLYPAAVLFFVFPLANADLRLLLFPFMILLKLFGRKINCPATHSIGNHI